MTIRPTVFSKESKGGAFRFGRQTTMFVSPELDADMVQIIKELWGNFCLGKGELSIIADKSIKPFCLSVGRAGSNKNSAKEYSYVLEADDSGVDIIALDKIGMMQGFFSLLQLITPSNLTDSLEAFYIKGCLIKDKPKVQLRMIHICVFPETRLEFLHKVIRFCAIAKYTHIVLEFWGMLKLDCMKELSWPQAFTKEQIRPIIAEANAMGLEIVPMFNHLGHAAAARERYAKHVVLDQNPALALLFEPDGWTWCLSNPQTIGLLKEVRKELSELCGEGKYFHLGCDETYTFATCDKCDNQDQLDLLAGYLNDVAAELKQQGRRGIIWGDALLEKKSWPGYTATSRPPQNTHLVIDKLDKELIIADWQYEIKEQPVKTTEYFMEKGFDVLLTPWGNIHNIETLAQEAADKGALGLMVTTWHTIEIIMPSVLYAANAAWAGPPFDVATTVYNVYSAMLQRKIMPAKSYSDSGWGERQI